MHYNAMRNTYDLRYIFSVWNTMSTQHTQSIETLVNVDTFTLTEILAFTIHYGIFEILACPDKCVKDSWTLPHRNSLIKFETTNLFWYTPQTRNTGYWWYIKHSWTIFHKNSLDIYELLPYCNSLPLDEHITCPNTLADIEILCHCNSLRI